MKWKQVRNFSVIFFGFGAFSSLLIYPLGVFDYGRQSFIVLAAAYIVCGFFMYRYFRQNPSALEKLF